MPIIVDNHKNHSFHLSLDRKECMFMLQIPLAITMLLVLLLVG